MKNNPIIYCHYGNSKYLSYVFKIAKLSNPDAEIILLGDPSNKKVAQDCGLTHYSLKDYDFGQDLKTFDEVYELIATPEFDAFKHGDDWNKFVFRKWFILYNFVTKHGIKNFWHFDSDNMIISDLSTLEYKYLDLDCTVQCHGQCFKGFFVNPEIIDRYNKKINELFLRKDYIAGLKAGLVNYNGPYSFNEMTVYEVFKREEKFKAVEINKIADDSSYFGEVIARSDGMKMEKLPFGEDVQIVHMNQDARLFCIEEATNKPILMHVINLSWMPIYVYAGILEHFRKNYKKPKQSFSDKSKTLAQIAVPLRQRFKQWRKSLKKKRRG